MATAKQIALKIKYAKTTINSLTKKINMYKAKVGPLEAELKKAKAASGRSPRPRGSTTSTGPRKK